MTIRLSGNYILPDLNSCVALLTLTRQGNPYSLATTAPSEKHVYTFYLQA